MAKEFNVPTLTGQTVYVLLKKPDGTFADITNETFEVYDTASRGDYDIALTELGTASGIYQGDFPTWITSSGTYEFFAYLQAGGSPAETDTLLATGEVDWTGSASVSSTTGAMTASDWRTYLLGTKGFKRTDKDTEIYASTTDAIQIMRRRFKFDEAKTETTTTDTISTLGDFKLTIESDQGMVIGVVLEDDDTGTPLIQVPKWKFDELYPSVNVETDRGYPRNFCIYAGSIYLGPIPDDTDYSYRISYSRRAGTITSSTSGVPFTNLYRDILADLTLSILYRGLGEMEMADYLEARFEREFPNATRQERINSGEHFFVSRQNTI